MRKLISIIFCIEAGIIILSYGCQNPKATDKAIKASKNVVKFIEKHATDIPTVISGAKKINKTYNQNHFQDSLLKNP